MTLKVKSGGSWVDASPKAKHSGTWKQVQEVWAKFSGTWQLVWQNAIADLVPTPNFDVYRPSVSCTATVTFSGDGSWTGSASAGASISGTYSGIWLDGGSPSDFEMQLVPTAGSFTTNDLSSYVAMSSDRAASIASGPGESSVTYTANIRRASDLVVVHSETGCFMSAERVI